MIKKRSKKIKRKSNNKSLCFDFIFSSTLTENIHLMGIKIPYLFSIDLYTVWAINSIQIAKMIDKIIFFFFLLVFLCNNIIFFFPSNVSMSASRFYLDAHRTSIKKKRKEKFVAIEMFVLVLVVENIFFIYWRKFLA